MEETKPRIKILVACHKADPNIRQDDIYMPIQVGKTLHPDLDLGFQCDNTGDNISHKNASYCELTAIYWAWKNLKDVDYIGLCHYRRYFDIKRDDIIKILKNNDIILSSSGVTSYSNLIHLTEGTTREDVYILLLFLKKYYPELTDTVVSYLYNCNQWIGGNMFITRYEIFDKYCNWLFSVLCEVEKIVKPHMYSRLKRLMGYYGEILLPIFCIHEHLRVKYISQTGSHNIMRYNISNVVKTICFKLSNRKAKTLIIPASTLVSFKLDKIDI